MIQIDAFPLEQSSHLAKRARLVIDRVLARVVSKCGSSDNQLRVRYQEKVVDTRLFISSGAAKATHQINDLPEPHLD